MKSFVETVRNINKCNTVPAESLGPNIKMVLTTVFAMPIFAFLDGKTPSQSCDEGRGLFSICPSTLYPHGTACGSPGINMDNK